jgi:hypothetical protein
MLLSQQIGRAGVYKWPAQARKDLVIDCLVVTCELLRTLNEIDRRILVEQIRDRMHEFDPANDAARIEREAAIVELHDTMLGRG